MMRRTRWWVWCGRIVAGLIIVGVAVYLFRAGLDRADKIASGSGLLVALVALFAPYLLPPPGRASSEQSQGSQVVSDAAVGGRLTQARNVRGRLRVSPTPPSSVSAGDSAGRRPSSTADAPPVEPGGQAVQGVWVGGDLTQADGVDGDVTLG